MTRPGQTGFTGELVLSSEQAFLLSHGLFWPETDQRLKLVYVYLSDDECALSLEHPSPGPPGLKGSESEGQSHIDCSDNLLTSALN